MVVFRILMVWCMQVCTVNRFFTKDALPNNHCATFYVVISCSKANFIGQSRQQNTTDLHKIQAYSSVWFSAGKKYNFSVHLCTGKHDYNLDFTALGKQTPLTCLRKKTILFV